MRKKALFVTLVLALLAGLVGFSATPAHAAPLAFGGPSACYWGGIISPRGMSCGRVGGSVRTARFTTLSVKIAPYFKG